MSAFVGAKAYRSAAHSVPGSGGSFIPWDAEEFDTSGFHDNATQPSRFTVPAGLGGKFVFGGNWATTTGSADSRIYDIAAYKNGTLVKGSHNSLDVETGGVNTTTPAFTAMVGVDLVDGDYMELRVGSWHDQTVAMDTALAAAWIYRTPDPSEPFVGVLAKRTGALTSSANAWTDLPLDAEEFDTDGFHSTSSNQSHLTVPSGKGGKYHVGASYSLNGGSPDNTLHRLRLRVNGTTYVRGAAWENRQSGNVGFAYPGCWVQTLVDLAAGDFVQAMYYLDGSYAMEVGNTVGFWMMRVGS